MASAVSEAVRGARRAAGLTQAQLAARLGLKPRAVSRWERGKSEPSRRHQRAMVAVIGERNAEAATALAASLGSAGAGTGSIAAVPALALVANAAVGTNVDLTLERAVFAMADELDLAPRRVRVAVVRLLERMQGNNIPIDVALRGIRGANQGG